MCGIVGVASIDSRLNCNWLFIAGKFLTHRGPDDAGEWWSEDRRVYLSHRRLAIIDLSPAAHQPMMDERGELVVVYNGELYNFRELRKELEDLGYRFRSNSDTEVLLYAYREWGVKGLERFNGMFAFALYDCRNRQLFLARDRAGEKPLFYYLSNGTLRFASELKALLADPELPRRIDLEALDCYLAMGFVPGERCILQGFRKLPPAHAAIFSLDEGDLKVWRYWDLPEPPEDRPLTPKEEATLLEELEFLLEDAVRRQLVADVPVGILLSGGVDSSLVTAMAVRNANSIRTFTVRFPGHGQLDETEHARRVARYFDTEHIELDATEISPDILSILARHYDEPIVDSSMIPTYLVCKLVRQYCTVALGGDGGDELFGGYQHYNRLLWLNSRLGWIPRMIRRGIARATSKVLPVGFKGRNYLKALEVDYKNGGLPLVASYFDQASRLALIGKLKMCETPAESIWSNRASKVANLLHRATRTDFGNYLAEDILVKVDRASMANSLEIRAPFLDYRIIEFAFGKVPSFLKVIPKGRKILIKRLCAKVLPPNFDMDRKQGFSIPLGTWLCSGPWREAFNDILLGVSDVIFDRSFVGSLLDGMSRGRSNSERLFALALFESWRREYRVTV